MFGKSRLRAAFFMSPPGSAAAFQKCSGFSQANKPGCWLKCSGYRVGFRTGSVLVLGIGLRGSLLPTYKNNCSQNN